MFSRFLRRVVIMPPLQRRFYESSNQMPSEEDSYTDWSQPRVRKQTGTPFDEVRNSYKSGPIPNDTFIGISNAPLSKDILAVLITPPNPADIKIKRLDGGLYISTDFYLNLLNKAVGVGGWSIIPISEPTFYQSQEGVKFLIREFSFYILGRFVSLGIGEAPWYTGSGQKSGIVSAYEIAKRDALTLCCKEIGMAQCLYNEEFAKNWRDKYADRTMCENTITKVTKSFWLKKDSEAIISYPWQRCSNYSNS